jgi:hypothetical protein
VFSQNRAKLQAAAEKRRKVMEAADPDHKTRHHLKKAAKLRPPGKDAYVGKDTLKKSSTGEGVGYELINRAKEILDEEFREERRRIRLLTLDDDRAWKQEKMAMWKQEIIDNNEHLVVPALHLC